MSKPGRNDLCPCGSGKKYKKCCLAETFVQSGKEETARKRLVDNLLTFYNRQHKETIEECVWNLHQETKKRIENGKNHYKTITIGSNSPIEEKHETS